MSKEFIVLFIDAIGMLIIGVIIGRNMSKAPNYDRSRYIHEQKLDHKITIDYIRIEDRGKDVWLKLKNGRKIISIEEVIRRGQDE